MSSRNGPIIIIEDDLDDQEIFETACQSLQVPNKLIFFSNSTDALNFLMDTPENPFLIISDINMPVMSGLELRHEITRTDRLRMKSIPFVFLSTGSRIEHVIYAYEMMVQGYFEKPNNLKGMQDLLRMVFDYWKVCKHPNAD